MRRRRLIQLPLFSDLSLTGEERKVIGMTTAIDHAYEEWKIEYVAAACVVAARGGEFTAEDITFICGLPRKTATNRNNSVGAMTSGLAKRGWIAWTGRMVRAMRPTSHSAVLSVWRKGSVPFPMEAGSASS